jgi:histidinol-phosphate aminotransferase
LRAALAEDSGLELEHILVGCGADELIDLIMRLGFSSSCTCFFVELVASELSNHKWCKCRCVLEPGDKIVDCPPTFTMYEFDASVNAALTIKGS